MGSECVSDAEVWDSWDHAHKYNTNLQSSVACLLRWQHWPAQHRPRHIANSQPFFFFSFFSFVKTYISPGLWALPSFVCIISRPTDVCFLKGQFSRQGVLDCLEGGQTEERRRGRRCFTWCWASSRFPLAHRESPRRWQIDPINNRVDLMRISCEHSLGGTSENVLVISSTCLRPQPKRTTHRWRLFSEKWRLSL